MDQASLSSSPSALWLAVRKFPDGTPSGNITTTLQKELDDSGFQLADTPQVGKSFSVGVLNAGKWENPPLGKAVEFKNENLSGPGLSEFVPADKMNVQFFANATGTAVPNNYLWISQATIMGTAPDAPQLLVMRGINLDRLADFLNLPSRSDVQLALNTEGDAVSHPFGPGWVDRAIDIRGGKLLVGIKPSRDAPEAELWVLTLLAGLGLTSAWVAWNAGQAVSKRANNLTTVLSTVESKLAAKTEKEEAFFDFSAAASCETDANTGKLLRVNDEFCRMMGYSRAQLLTMTFRDISHPDDLQYGDEKIQEAIGAGRSQFEKRYLRGDGSAIWAIVTTRRYDDPVLRQRYFLTSIVDITDRKRGEQIKNQLLRELSHRARNTMQLAVTIARQTQKTSRNVADYERKVVSRLSAINLAQDLLFETDWISADASKIARRIFESFLGDEIKVSIPSIALPTQHAQTFALAMNELAANALQMIEDGERHEISLVGEIGKSTPETKALNLRLRIENPGKPIRPRRSGFGHQMLMRGLPDQFSGSAQESWTQEEYLYSASLPLPVPS